MGANRILRIVCNFEMIQKKNVEKVGSIQKNVFFGCSRALKQLKKNDTPLTTHRDAKTEKHSPTVGWQTARVA